MIKKIIGGLIFICGLVIVVFATINSISEYKSGDSTIGSLFVLLGIAGLVFLWVGWRVFRTEIKLISKEEQSSVGILPLTAGEAIGCAHRVLRKNKNVIWLMWIIMILIDLFLNFQKLIEQKIIPDIPGLMHISFLVLVVFLLILPSYWKVANDIIETKNWEIKQFPTAIKTMFGPMIFFLALTGIFLLTLSILFYAVWPTIFGLRGQTLFFALVLILVPISLIGFLYFVLRALRPDLRYWSSIKLSLKSAITKNYWGVLGVLFTIGIINRILDKASGEIWELWSFSPALFFLILIVSSLVSAYLICWWFVSVTAYLKPRWQLWLSEKF